MPQMKIQRMHITCWVTKSTNAHSEYVILIVFSIQTLLQERESVLHCTCIVLLFLNF